MRLIIFGFMDDLPRKQSQLLGQRISSVSSRPRRCLVSGDRWRATVARATSAMSASLSLAKPHVLIGIVFQ
jgi:hypothetical protein